MVCSPLAWAESTAPALPGGTSGEAAVAGQAPGLGSMLVPFGVMFAIMYFLMIRPQQKKMKEQQELLAALKDGDEVLTQSGILGKVAGITDKVITLEVSSNVRVKMLKSQVTQVIKGPIQEAIKDRA